MEKPDIPHFMKLIARVGEIYGKPISASLAELYCDLPASLPDINIYI